MVITASTNYTVEGLKTFQRVAARRVSKGFYAALRFVYLILGLCVFGGGIYYTVTVLGGNYDIVVIALAAIGLYLGAQLLWMGVTYYDYFANQAMKKIPPKSLRNYYSFEDEQIVISNQMRSGSYPYSQFGVVFETRNYFLFYINKRNGYVLEKRGIENATPEELRELLNRKLVDPVVQVEDI